MQSMTVFAPDQLTLHFPSGSGIPAATLRCSVMSHMEWRRYLSRTCVPHSVGAAVCIWLQQLLGCGWMKINTSFTVWLFWLLKHKATSMFSLITIGEHWRMLRATRLKDNMNIQAKLSNMAINNLNPCVLSSPHSFSLFQIPCRNPSGSF